MWRELCPTPSILGIVGRLGEVLGKPQKEKHDGGIKVHSEKRRKVLFPIIWICGSVGFYIFAPVRKGQGRDESRQYGGRIGAQSPQFLDFGPHELG